MKVNLIISDSFYFIKDAINSIYGNFDNVIKINYENTELDEILYEISAVSLFDDKKYVIIENAEDIFSKDFKDEDLINYLNNPSDLTVLTFVTSKVDAKSEVYKIISSKYKIFDSTTKKKNNYIYDVKKYVIDHKSHISDKALNYIKEACLNDYDLMLKEVDKLLILGKDNISDELVYGLVALTPDGNTNRFIDALMDINEEEALECVTNMKILNIDITKLVALIAWNLRVTYLIKIHRKDKTKLEEVLKKFNISDYRYNNFVRRGNIRSVEEFENLIDGLGEVDYLLKTFKLDKDDIGYYLINMFCI